MACLSEAKANVAYPVPIPGQIRVKQAGIKILTPPPPSCVTFGKSFPLPEAHLCSGDNEEAGRGVVRIK